MGKPEETVGQGGSPPVSGGRFFFVALAVLLGWLGWLVAGESDDGKDRTKGGQIGAWSAEERDEAMGLCRRFAGGYGESSCRVQAFCQCAVPNYEGRAPFREFRDSLAPAVAVYVRKGQYGYFCTARAASACDETE